MRFFVDECAGPAVAGWIQAQGHEVFSVYDLARGMDDDTIIRMAFEEEWIIITTDKDFGEKVYRDRKLHRGVVLLRLDDERVSSKIGVMTHLLRSYADRLADQFVVVTEKSVRFAKPG
jgi:predicted nuclease of predicted toxin-antitoxin system